MNEKQLTHIDLFSGIAGFALAARWAGFRTIAFCEIEPFAQAVIAKNFGAKVVSDSASVGLHNEKDKQELEGARGDKLLSEQSRDTLADTKGGQPREQAEHEGGQDIGGGSTQEPVPIYPDVRKFDGTKYRGATLLTGGFPCQPFSCAGKRKGKEDHRFIWPEMLRIIKEARPTWVIGENVAGLIKMELDNCVSQLEAEGYAVQPLVIPACATDAHHRRDRVWIICRRNETGVLPSYANSKGLQGHRGEHIPRQGKAEGPTGVRGEDTGAKVGFAESFMGRLADGLPNGLVGWYSWPEEPKEIPRIAVGIEQRVSKLKALGNAIVPQVAYEIIRGIAMIEKENNSLIEEICGEWQGPIVPKEDK